MPKAAKGTARDFVLTIQVWLSDRRKIDLVWLPEEFLPDDTPDPTLDVNHYIDLVHNQTLGSGDHRYLQFPCHDTEDGQPSRLVVAARELVTYSVTYREVPEDSAQGSGHAQPA